MIAHRHSMEKQMTNPRLRVLELPVEHQGEHKNAPYLLVIDRCDDETTQNMRMADTEALQASTGARGLLSFGFEIDIE